MKIIELIHREGTVLVDDSDYEELDKYNWRLKRERNILYARRTTTKEERESGYPQAVVMHRQIMGIVTDRSIQIDHRDSNGLNNQRSNLRIATKQQNTANMSKYSGRYSSTYKGVFKAHGQYIAQIGFNNKIIRLGYFTNEVDAAIAYNSKAIELFGEYASLNEINQEEKI